MNIYDIAQRSGVSIATVSRVLNGNPNVSDKTREKVLAVIKEKKYTPNAFARGLGLNTMKMVGILCTDVADTFYAKAVSLVERNLRQHGFNVLLSCTGTELEDKKKGLQLLLNKCVDAIILIGSPFKEMSDNSHITSAAQEVPVLIINGMVEYPNVFCVYCDEKDAVYKNVGLLALQGYRRILYLYDKLTYSGTQKISGYKKGCEKNGLQLDQNLIVNVKKDVDAIQKRVTLLMEKGMQFSAVIAAEDLLAIGAQKALLAAGKECPIIGFNNSILAQCATPALTSVDNMLDTICPAAVNLLMDLLNGETVSQKLVISSRLVERDTFRTNSIRPME